MGAPARLERAACGFEVVEKTIRREFSFSFHEEVFVVLCLLPLHPGASTVVSRHSKQEKDTSPAEIPEDMFAALVKR